MPKKNSNRVVNKQDKTAMIDMDILLTKYKQGDTVKVDGETKIVKSVGKLGGERTVWFTDGTSTGLDDLVAQNREPAPLTRSTLASIEKQWAKEHLLRHRGERLFGTPYKFGQRVKWEDATWLVYDHDAQGSSSVLVLITPNLSEMVRGVPLDLSSGVPGKTASKQGLKKALVRLAHENPDLRAHVLSLLKNR